MQEDHPVVRHNVRQTCKLCLFILRFKRLLCDKQVQIYMTLYMTLYTPRSRKIFKIVGLSSVSI